MHRAFSLVELSIVLVILGLLTGGILTGQSLIRAAELRAVTTEMNNYQVAAQTFRSKYRALPGDMRNATAFWGELNSTPFTCRSTVSTTTATCNGNGDGLIVRSDASDEFVRFWQHLANAGLIEGTYNGATVGSSTSFTIEVPQSKMSNGRWFAASSYAFMRGQIVNTVEFTPTDQFNVLIEGRNFFTISQATTSSRHIASGAQPLWPAVLTPEEAWNIDTKIDDGRPAYGKVIASIVYACTDAANVTDLDSDYLLSDTSVQCALHFLDAF